MTARLPRLRLLIVVLACQTLPAWAARDCPQFYAGGQLPVLTNAKLKAKTRELCFSAFGTMHSGVTRGPLWSAEHLQRANIEAARDLIRRNTFHAEGRLPKSERAEISDFSRSGYDRGHLSPNADMADAAAENEAFSLANIVPQSPPNNIGIWKGVEAVVRQLAVDEGELYVITGPAFIGTQVRQIGRGVLVPTHLWKVVYSPKQRAAGAYLVTNDDTRDYSSLSIAELGRLIGIELLPALSVKVREAGMVLPKPTGQRGSRKRGSGSSGQDDEFRLKEFVRGLFERFGGQK